MQEDSGVWKREGFEAEIPDDFQNFMKTRMDIKISDFKEILKKIELIECQELSVI